MGDIKPNQYKHVSIYPLFSLISILLVENYRLNDGQIKNIRRVMSKNKQLINFCTCGKIAALFAGSWRNFLLKLKNIVADRCDMSGIAIGSVEILFEWSFCRYRITFGATFEIYDDGIKKPLLFRSIWTSVKPRRVQRTLNRHFWFPS